MVTDPRVIGIARRLDDGQVEANREMRAGGRLEPAPRTVVQMGALAMVDALLGGAEGARSPPTDLDDHELTRRTRIDRDDVELCAPGVDLAGEDRPAGADQLVHHGRFGGVTGLLS
jgi:hypothetical protein